MHQHLCICLFSVLCILYRSNPCLLFIHWISQEIASYQRNSSEPPAGVPACKRLSSHLPVQEDIEKNRFNPLKELYHELSKEQFDNYVKEILMMIATDMAKIYECLPIVEETAILRNIIYSGIWVRFMTKQNDAENGKQ